MLFIPRQIASVLLAVVLCLLFAQTDFGQRLSFSFLDLQFALRGPLPTSQQIVIVGVDEASLKEIGPWPFPRSTHAALLDRLSQAKGVAFDLLFVHAAEDDFQLFQAIKKAPPVTLAVARNYQGERVGPPELLEGEVKTGHVETILGEDGVVRQVELLAGEIPALALALLNGVGGVFSASLQERSQLINFYGEEFTFLYISYADLFHGRVDDDFFAGRYVLVGSQALAQGDVHITPFSRNHPLPGVELQATIFNNLLEKEFLTPQPAGSLFVALLFLGQAILVWPAGRELNNAIIGLFTVLAAGLFSHICFRYNLFIDLVIPLLFAVLLYFIHIIVQLIWVTKTVVGQISELDRELEGGMSQVFQTIPTSLLPAVEVPGKRKIPSGIARHMVRVNNGIAVLALQNRFINHLLSEETPPLILWQENSGQIMFANRGFKELWQQFMGSAVSLPSLIDFLEMLDNHHNRVERETTPPQDNQPQSSIQKRMFGKDRNADIIFSRLGRSCYFRVVMHQVEGSVLGISGVLASFTNVTELRELEKAKGEMMSIVSHELRLPLTTILGYGEMLARSGKGEERWYAEKICDQAQRLAKMIDDFLDIARLENGEGLFKVYPYDFLSLIHDALSAVGYSAASKNIQIDLELPAKVTHLLGDEGLMT